MSEILLPALLVVLPILGATLPLLLGLVRTQVGWSVTALVLAVESALATWLAYTVYIGENRVVHVLGGDTFGRKDQALADGRETENFIVGIELVADALSTAIVLTIAVVSLAVLAYSRRRGPRGNAFYSGYLLLTGGLMGVVLTGDLFNLFVFLEIVGLATYALVASDDSPESAVAALKYLVIGTAGASLYLVGVGYIYLQTGALNMVDVSRSLAGDPAWIDSSLYGDPLVGAAFAFIAAGLLTKAAIFPLHTWQPDAYAEAPDAVTIYISALVSTASAYAFARVVWTVFTPDFFAVNPVAVNAILALAAISVLAGSVLAASQRRIKRMFAYSSVAQFGLIVLAVGVAVHPESGADATRFAVYGVVIHLVAHAIMKGGAFATAGALASNGARRVRDYAGLARTHPFLSGSLAILGFGLVGVPPTVGFIGKWYIALGAVESGLWLVVFVVFASTLLTMLYVARLLEKLYFDHQPEETPAHAESSVPVATDGGRTLSTGMIALAVGAALVSVALGFSGGIVTDWITPLVDAVIESAPEVIPDG